MAQVTRRETIFTFRDGQRLDGKPRRVPNLEDQEFKGWFLDISAANRFLRRLGWSRRTLKPGDRVRFNFGTDGDDAGSYTLSLAAFREERIGGEVYDIFEGDSWSVVKGPATKVRAWLTRERHFQPGLPYADGRVVPISGEFA